MPGSLMDNRRRGSIGIGRASLSLFMPWTFSEIVSRTYSL